MNPTRRIFRLLFAMCCLLSTGVVAAQGTSATAPQTPVRKGVTGIWRGYFITEGGEQYKLEFQIDQPTGAVRGISYSYLDQRFYGKSTMKGVFNAATSRFTIEEVRTVEVRNTGGGGTCLMNYKLAFTRSGKELFLEGTYLGKREDRANPKNNGTWGDCGGGRVYLRRVETSDFYEEPFLRRRDSISRAITPAPKTPPVARRTTPAQAAPKPPVKRPASNPVTRTTPPKPKTEQPPVTKVPTRVEPAQAEATPVPKRAEPIPVPVQTRNRENATAKVLDVYHSEILVKLYDNGEIDGDTISVYLDNKLVLAHKGLSASPLELRVKLDPGSPEHTLIMVAENMGRIPPNTSLMIVWDGDKRYEVQITSTEQKNAMVRFRYAGPAAGTP
ncbi:MAG: hypothetical protein EOO08_05715 [Chitinophagaceae bacterium]|nr:MAG: hypothetical protein EOO08_05715 [Chitinophagaceae bacterium]